MGLVRLRGGPYTPLSAQSLPPHPVPPLNPSRFGFFIYTLRLIRIMLTLL